MAKFRNLNRLIEKMDDLTPDQRRKNMQRIKSKDTNPEIVLRKALWAKGYRYRKNYKELPGKPDIVLTKYKLCIFIDSEFFHGKNFDSGYHSSKYQSLREQLEAGERANYWLPKIERNIKRDRLVDAELKDRGWHVVRFWSKDILKGMDICVKIVEGIINKCK